MPNRCPLPTFTDWRRRKRMTMPGTDGGCPYNGLPERSFFRNSILRQGELGMERDSNFAMTPSTRVMSAGSCFAARIANFIRMSGVTYLGADDRIANDGESIQEEAPSLFSLRYGNIYTTKHLLQLLQRAIGRLSVEPPITCDRNGRFRNLLRPSVLSYASPEILRADDLAHLSNVKALLGEADVFIFTLGLTEYWMDSETGLALPSTPGCGHGEFDPKRHRFHNASLSEVVDELQHCLALLQQINPNLRVLLTLSPVPLVATYTPVSAVEATFYSKSLLRQAIASTIASPPRNAAYFPSYEIITNPHVIAENFEEDMRSVSEAGVARVMAHFRHRYLASDGECGAIEIPSLSIDPQISIATAAHTEVNPVCDEENIWTAYLNRKDA
jgi:GSCFA family